MNSRTSEPTPPEAAGSGSKPSPWPRMLGIAAFLAALWVPIVQMTFPFVTEYEDTENRDLAEPPSLALADLPKLIPGTESYLADRFGLRTSLIRWNSILRVGLLGVSPIPSVLIGKDGWQEI